MELAIGNSYVGINHPTYFVADIAANHDNELSRALDLIEQCAQAGANAAKFQNFNASTIVSDHGFQALSGLTSHQSQWKESVYKTYEKVALSLEWTQKLKQKCDECNIDYLTAIYDTGMIDHFRQFVCAWKIGSGDISWIDLIDKLSQTDKPLMIATGASSLADVRSAMIVASRNTNKIVLMQCNTNYTGSLENFKYVNLNVLKRYQVEFPKAILGLSDHTPGHSTVLGAVALGARVIEKHFTDDILREGPDHKFSMDPQSWIEMVKRTRELENALGDGCKKVEDNEKETYIIQRRALRASSDLSAGTTLRRQHIIPLRPCPHEGLDPSRYDQLLGRVTTRDICKGELLNLIDTIDLA